MTTRPTRPATVAHYLVRALLFDLINDGWELVSVDDGDEPIALPPVDWNRGGAIAPANKAMEHIFSVGEAWLYVRKREGGDKLHGIWIIPGNEADNPSDYSYRVQDPDGFAKWMDEWTTNNDFNQPETVVAAAERLGTWPDGWRGPCNVRFK